MKPLTPGAVLLILGTVLVIGGALERHDGALTVGMILVALAIAWVVVTLLRGEVS